MKRVEIPFLPEFEKRMLDGRKTATTRTERYGEVGDVFEAFGEGFVLTSVRQRSLREIAFRHYHEEGFETPNDFLKIWKHLHPRRVFDISESFWFHKFKRVKKEGTLWSRED